MTHLCVIAEHAQFSPAMRAHWKRSLQNICSNGTAFICRTYQVFKMRQWRTFKRLLAHCRPRPKVGLQRRNVQLHARSREGPDDCRRQQVNCTSFLPSSVAFVSPLISWEPYSAIFLQACWFRYSNGSKKGPQSCMDTSSQILLSIIIFLVWRKLRSVRKRTKQLCLVGGHFYFGTKGCAQFKTLPLKS